MTTYTITTIHAFRAEAPDQFGRRWLHLLPAGKFKARDGRGPFDATDLSGILERTRKHLGQTLMMIDYDHQAISTAVKEGRSRAPAAGWIGDFQIRDDGLWGLAELTEASEKQVAAREYRYISPAFLTDRRGRISLIHNVALVNMPALELTSMSLKEHSMETEIADLRQLLGLDEEAEWSAILDAVRKLKEANAEPGPAKFVPMSVFADAMAEANSLRQGIADIDARHHVETLCRSGRLMPALKGWAINLATMNKPALDAFVEKTGPVFKNLVTPQLGNRRLTPETDADLEDNQSEVARNLGLTHEQFTAGLPVQIER